MIKKFITKVKKWRIVGYGILIVEFFKIHEPQQATIESFLLVVLGELSARTGKPTSSPKEYQDNNLGTNSQNLSNSSSIENNLGNTKDDIGSSNNKSSIEKE